MSACEPDTPTPEAPTHDTAAASTATPADAYDSPWKEVIDRFFPYFMAMFAPDLHAEIDWSKGYDFLEQELEAVLRDAETGPRRVDKVAKVHLLNGEERYVVLHVEVQVTRESGFERRMFIYFYRLYDLYPEKVVSLAVLADEEPGWKPRRYKYAQHQTHVMFGFRTVKLWEYNERWAELEADPNPFAVVIMAHLKTKATRGNAEERLRWKVELVRQLYARGYTREEIYALFQFLDWLLVLPPEMAKSFRERVRGIEQESKMQYVTSIERLGREEGREEGRDECLRETAVELFEEKFGPLDTSKRNLLDKASQEQVLTWMKRLLTASSLDEVLAT